MGRLSSKKDIKIQGKCPRCGLEGTVKFVDHIHYIDGIRSHSCEDLPTCTNCDEDEIRIRKINNRRYKVHEIQ